MLAYTFHLMQRLFSQTLVMQVIFSDEFTILFNPREGPGS